MSLETNMSKKELADKVRELTEKLKEMRGVEAQVNASVETLKTGSPAVGIHRDDKGNFFLVKIVYDLNQNAAAIIDKVELGRDQQIAGGKLVKEAGEAFLKATDIKFYK